MPAPYIPKVSPNIVVFQQPVHNKIALLTKKKKLALKKQEAKDEQRNKELDEKASTRAAAERVEKETIPLVVVLLFERMGKIQKRIMKQLFLSN